MNAIFRATAVICLLMSSVQAEQDSTNSEMPPVVARWIESNSDVWSASATFVRYDYDRVFLVRKTGSGSLYFAQRGDASLEIGPREEADEDRPEQVQHGARTYAARANDAESLRWNADRLVLVDRYTRRELPDLDFNFLGIKTHLGFSRLMPFSPGLPDKQSLSDWKFSVQCECEDDVHIRATPRKSAAATYKLCDLLIDRKRMRLQAVRYLDVTGNRETVYVFQSVSLNPCEPHQPLFNPQLVTPARPHTVLQ